MRFTSETVHRSQLKNAPYNPRRISDKALAKLKENLKRVGLIQPPIWNKRTGHIVGGHQKVALLDKLAGTKDYLIPVAVVDMDDKTEKEQNIFLNNADAQGEFDLSKLQEMFKDPQLDLAATGFDLGEVYHMFGADPFASRPDETEELGTAIRDGANRMEEIREKGSKFDPTEFYLVAVFRDDEARVVFTEALGLPDNRYVDGRLLLELIRAKREAAVVTNDA